MIIEKVIIENYRCFQKLDLDFKSSFNIVVGKNETDKSTLLEVINLCLTGQLNGRSIQYELTPYPFLLEDW